MRMHNPPHPGDFIFEIYVKPYNLSIRQIAEKLYVSPSTFSRLVNGESNISPEMALRLSKAFGRTPESWLSMQDNYDLWHTRKRLDISEIKKVNLIAA